MSSNQFDVHETRTAFEIAKRKNSPRKLDPVDPDVFVSRYTKESRGDLNRAIWYRQLPVDHPFSNKRYETLEEAYMKLIYDAQFYVEDWEKVKEVARRSYYPTTF